jgi:hypothetical protein
MAAWISPAGDTVVKTVVMVGMAASELRLGVES